MSEGARGWRAFAWVAAAGVGAVGAGLSLSTTTACTTHNCDPSTDAVDFRKPDVGFRTMLPEGQVLLQSSAWDGTWRDYDANVTITVNYPVGFAALGAPQVWVSTGKNQDDAGATATSAAGQLDQVMNVNACGFQLQNGTCAGYSVYFQVTGTLDAGADASPCAK